MLLRVCAWHPKHFGRGRVRLLGIVAWRPWFRLNVSHGICSRCRELVLERDHPQGARIRRGVALFLAACTLGLGSALAQPPVVYETRAPTLTAIAVLDYAWVLAQPIGSCAAAWQPLYLVTGPLLAGDVVTAHATLMLSARESAAQAAVGWVIHVEPWTGTLPLNVAMPCMTEPWVGEDISAAYRPYLATSAHRVIVVDRDLPAGMLVLYRVYAQSATPGGPLVIAPTSPDLVVTVQR